MEQKQRCTWCKDDDLYVNYHDTEWGVPLYDSQQLFEFIILEGMQAGLSWITVLRKREHFREVFVNFDPQKIAKFTPKKIAALLTDPGIIRNRLKINATVQNAKAYLALQEQGINFSEYLWQFTEGRPVVNAWKTSQHVPVTTPQAQAMAKTLKKAGFNFVGETICYAFMQAVGMVNDHLVSCYRHEELTG